MRNFLATMAAVLALASANYADGGVSVNINVNTPPEVPHGYILVSDNDDNMFRDDLVMINGNLIGFWITLPSGIHVLHCRKMWYHKKHGEWYYGPWYEDRGRVVYSAYIRGPYFNVRFFDYMGKHYPGYYEKRFRKFREMRQAVKRHEKAEQKRDQYIERHDVPKKPPAKKSGHAGHGRGK